MIAAAAEERFTFNRVIFCQLELSNILRAQPHARNDAAEITKYKKQP